MRCASAAYRSRWDSPSSSPLRHLAGLALLLTLPIVPPPHPLPYHDGQHGRYGGHGRHGGHGHVWHDAGNVPKHACRNAGHDAVQHVDDDDAWDAGHAVDEPVLHITKGPVLLVVLGCPCRVERGVCWCHHWLLPVCCACHHWRGVCEEAGAPCHVEPA